MATPEARGAPVVVSDGSVGKAHGGVAAECAVRELVTRAEHFGLEDLQRQVAALDQELADGRRCGETTCVALWVTRPSHDGRAAAGTTTRRRCW